MNAEALTALGQNARAWARCYTSLVEALIAEGVEEEVARSEARYAATMVVLPEDDEPQPIGPLCPVCGR